MHRELYGISGRKLHGKDTFARLVREKNDTFHVNHFAGALKALAASVFGLTHDQMYDPVIKEAPLETPIEMDLYLAQMSAWTGLNLQPAGKIATSPRELMQFIGTEYVRKAQQDYWIQRLVKDTAEFDKVLVPDARFPNEADAIRAAGGLVIKILRVDAPANPDEHPSETEIDKINPDLLVGSVSGNLSLPTRVAHLIAIGDFDRASLYDYRNAQTAIRAYMDGEPTWEAAMRLDGIGDKVSAMATILEYYNVSIHGM